MEIRLFGAVIVAAAGLLWATSGTQRERPLLTGAMPDLVRAREAAVTAHPGDPEATRALAQSYLDANQPGLALGLLGAGAPALRDDVRTQHLQARALLDEGRNEDALAIESGVVAACIPLAEGPRAGAATGCDGNLLGSALRRAAILRELVTLGVEDTRAYPEMSYVAYQNATREARVTPAGPSAL